MFAHRMCTVWRKSLSQPLKCSSLTPHEAPELAKLQAESFVCGSKVDIAEGVSARDSVAWEKSFLQLVFEVLVRCNSRPSSTPRLPPTALVVHSCERTTAIGNRKVCCSCFFRWSMVMACSSVHRRDDTLDLVQCPKTRQDYTCIYHYRLYNTRNLSAGTYGHQLYKHTRYVAISVKSKHVLKLKRVNTRQCNCT